MEGLREVVVMSEL